MAEVPALSPQPAGPAHPPETAMMTVPPMSPELAEAPESTVAPAVTLHMADSHQYHDAFLQP